VILTNHTTGARLQPGPPAPVCATGFHPNAHVSLVLHSTPIPVGSLTADSNGMIDGSVSISSTAPGGSHTLLANDGTLTESAPVTVGYDSTPPTLTAFALSPTSIDTS